MKKPLIEVTCDRCHRSVEVEFGHMRDLQKSGWLHTTMKIFGKSGKPTVLDLCPIHARPMLKALVKIDPETLEV